MSKPRTAASSAPPRSSARAFPAIVASENFGELGVGTLLALPSVLEDHGLDPVPLIKAAGMPADVFAHLGNRAPMQQMTLLLHLAARATGKEHFGVLVGQRFEMHMLGPVGYLMQNEATVHAALRRLVLDLRLYDRATVVSFENLGHRQIGLSYAVCTPNTPYAWMADDVAIMIGCRLLQALCGPACRPVEVQLAHGVPSDRTTYADLFGVPVRFDAPRSMIVIDRRWLDQPVSGADPNLLKLLDELLNAVRAAPVRLSDQVRRLLSSGVLARRADAPSIADLLWMSERSLRRRLAEEGTSLHVLTAEARLVIARQLLEQTHLPISEIAATLNYSDVTAFTRAFRSWTGKPPSTWRNAHRLKAAVEEPGRSSQPHPAGSPKALPARPT